PTLDVNLAAFAQKPLARIGQPSERHHAMPFGALLLGTAPVRETFGRRQREIRHVLTRVGQSTNHGASSQIADYDHLVDCHCHYLRSPLLRPLPVIGQDALCFDSRANFFPRGPYTLNRRAVRRFLDARAERAAGRATQRSGPDGLARRASEANATTESGGEAEIAGG